MKKATKIKIAKIIAICLIAVLWMGGIFKLSSMNSDNSNGHSTDILAVFIEDTLEVTNKAGITNSNPSDAKLAKATKLINAPLRKVMHASVYFVLAFIVMLICGIIFNHRRYAASCLIALAVAAIFACTDEFHQTLVPGRTGQALDVLIDSAGAAVGILFYSTYRFAYCLGMRHQKALTNKEKVDAKQR